MKAQFSHELLSSFYLWFEHKLVSNDSKAYKKDQSNSFVLTSFKDVPSTHVAYQGKFRQLVADQTVDKANSGIFVNSGFVTGANTGMYIDYNNGRIIFPVASGSGLTITANNTVKEVNTYLTEDDEEQLLIQGDFIDSSAQSSTHLFSKTSKLNEKTYILPACFINIIKGDSEPLSFGGEVDTKTRIRVIVMALDNYTLVGTLSLFEDTQEEIIRHIPYSAFPYGAFNSLKSYPYSYPALSSQYSTNSLIERVRTSKVTSPEIVNKFDKNVLIGFIDFDLSTYRFPRL